MDRTTDGHVLAQVQMSELLDYVDHLETLVCGLRTKLDDTTAMLLHTLDVDSWNN